MQENQNDPTSIFSELKDYAVGGGFYEDTRELLSEYLAYRVTRDQIKNQDQQQQGNLNQSSGSGSSVVASTSSMDTTKVLWAVAGVLVGIGLFGLLLRK